MTRSDASVTTHLQPRWRRILLHPGSLLAIGFIWLALAEVVPMFLSESCWGATRTIISTRRCRSWSPCG
jgi:hypothetical protein